MNYYGNNGSFANQNAYMQAMQYNPNYPQALQQQQMQQNMMLGQQPMMQGQQPQAKYGSSSTYDFVGKRVSSFQEVKEHPVGLDGKPMIFIDDVNSKLYFKFLDQNGEQSLQSFVINTNEATEKKVDEKINASIPANMDFQKMLDKINDLAKNFVSLEEFNKYKHDVDAIKGAILNVEKHNE